MRYVVTIHEVDEETGREVPRYQQTVDQIDMHTVINAVNSNTSAGRQRALRSDAGKPRTRKEEAPEPSDFPPSLP